MISARQAELRQLSETTGEMPSIGGRAIRIVNGPQAFAALGALHDRTEKVRSAVAKDISAAHDNRASPGGLRKSFAC